jgi:hypothetical protein
MSVCVCVYLGALGMDRGRRVQRQLLGRRLHGIGSDRPADKVGGFGAGVGGDHGARPPPESEELRVE